MRQREIERERCETERYIYRERCETERDRETECETERERGVRQRER